MVRFNGAFFWAIVVGVAMVALGCPSLSVQYFSDKYTATTSSGTGGTPCTSALACDDGNPCTAETCTDGSCVYIPLDKDPGPGSKGCTAFKCDNGVSVPTTKDGDPCGVSGKLKCKSNVCTGCTVHADCGKTDECQARTCQPDKTCMDVYMPAGTKVVTAKLPADLPGDCMATTCDSSGNIVLTADAMDVPPADGIECTDGHCLDGKPEQLPSAVGAPCADGVTFCNATKSCVKCATDANCAPKGKCYAETECVSCTDTTQNGDETGTDCGGSCGATCKDGKGCKVNGDCVNNLCAAGLCVSCFDGMQNNGEGGVDCGGSCAMKCKNGTPCSDLVDCIDGQCVDGVCCNTPCTGACLACNLPTKEGTCSPLAKGHDDPDSMCSGTMTCKNSSCVPDGGKGHFGATCATAGDCFSGICSAQTLTCN